MLVHHYLIIQKFLKHRHLLELYLDILHSNVLLLIDFFLFFYQELKKHYVNFHLMFKCTYRNRKISFEGIKLIYEQQLWQVLPESMIILLCAINIEEIQLLKMLTIIFDEYFHILPYFLFYLWKLFSKNKKRKSKRASLTFPTSFNEYSCQKNI